MSGGVLSMSEAERDRGFLVREAIACHIGQGEASERLGVSVRQFKRLVRAWKDAGDVGLVSRHRGRRSNNRMAADKRRRLCALLQDEIYRGFGATLMAETLLEREGLQVSAETVRQIQIELGLWRPKARRAKRVFQMRQRRARFGELIQIDGSPHDWFEGRGPRCTLIVFIDDATNRLTALRFAPSETTRAYLETVRMHVLAHGVPLAFYSDRYGIFRVNAKDAQSGDGKTEFGHLCGPSGYRGDPCADPSGEGPGGAGEPNLAGPSAQGDAPGRPILDRRGERLFADFHRTVEQTFWHTACQRNPGAPSLDRPAGGFGRRPGPA